MRNYFLFALFILTIGNLGSQSINVDFFPKDNSIDVQYKIDMDSWRTNYEWELVNQKYNNIWKKQMILEMNRLITVIPNQKDTITKNQELWQSSLEKSIELIHYNVDGNKVGRVPYIGWSMDITELYRQRAIYYFCLYYTIREQTEEDYNYKEKLVLAK